jgi:predicted N-acetyltransferase YhbS
VSQLWDDDAADQSRRAEQHVLPEVPAGVARLGEACEDGEEACEGAAACASGGLAVGDDGLRDMLVRLHLLPPLQPAMGRAGGAGIVIRRAVAADSSLYHRLVEREFDASWLGGIDVVLARKERTAFVATAGNQLIGFALWDVAYRGYFGPTGVAEAWRGRGIGAALLLSSLHAMRELGYAYVAIGKVGPAEFYERVCGAESIAGEPAP